MSFDTECIIPTEMRNIQQFQTNFRKTNKELLGFYVIKYIIEIKMFKHYKFMNFIILHFRKYVV